VAAVKAYQGSSFPSGPRTLVDGAQATGQITVDVGEIGCDYYVGSGHKWVCGPSGTAVCYIAPHAMDDFFPYPLQTCAPWPDNEPSEHATAASRMEAGECATTPLFPFKTSWRCVVIVASGANAVCGAGTSNVSSLVGLGAALQLWLRIAPSARAHVTRLATLLKQGALAIDGVSVVTPMDPEHSTGLTTLAFPALDREGLMTL